MASKKKYIFGNVRVSCYKISALLFITCHKKMYLVYCSWHSLLHLPTMLVMILANVFKLDVAFSGFECVLMLCTCGNGLQRSLTSM